MAAVLDPNWQSPYQPSAAERERHHRAVVAAAHARFRPYLVAAWAVFGIGVVLAVLELIKPQSFPALGLVAVVGAIFLAVTYARRYVATRGEETAGPQLAAALEGELPLWSDDTAHQRVTTIVDRLGATFGVGDVSVKLVRDEAYNAALLRAVAGHDLFVTEALARDFDLVELEGVIAHLMARSKLGVLERDSAASVGAREFTAARAIADGGGAFRADEVAAAAVQFPRGLARALERCAERGAPAGSFFATPRYAATRWVWFDRFSDGPSPVPGDLDEAPVRAAALAEW